MRLSYCSLNLAETEVGRELRTVTVHGLIERQLIAYPAVLRTFPTGLSFNCPFLASSSLPAVNYRRSITAFQSLEVFWRHVFACSCFGLLCLELSPVR